MSKTQLEDTFLHWWTLLGSPQQPVREFRFHPTRKWRADFAWPGKLVLVEIEGGVWRRSKGRHTNPTGFIKDCEKYNNAALLGYTVLRIPGPQLQTDPASAVELVAQVLAMRRTVGWKRQRAVGAIRRLSEWRG